MTSLGQGKAENWRRLSAGELGIHRLTRFPIERAAHDDRRIGRLSLISIRFDAPALSHEMARLAADEALDESGIGEPGAFPGQMFLAGPPVDVDWNKRFELARQRSSTPMSA